MKAITCTKYGSPDVLKLIEIDRPTPQANEILIKVHASSVTAADSMIRKGTPYFGRLFLGLFKPKIPITGTGFAGTVAGIGSSVKEFKFDDQVFGESIFASGSNAEYLCVAENGVVAIKPKNMSFEQASTLCDGALTSFNFLKEIAQVKNGQNVLINGASGSLGTAAIQLAKYFGAHVTAICSGSNFELVKSLGADKVINYKLEDFTKNTQQYDIIYDTVGKLSYCDSRQSLKPKGQFITPVLSLSILFQMLLPQFINSKQVKFSATGLLPPSKLKEFIHHIIEIINKEKLTSVIDLKFSLDDAKAAHSYVDQGHKKGNVVFSIG